MAAGVRVSLVSASVKELEDGVHALARAKRQAAARQATSAGGSSESGALCGAEDGAWCAVVKAQHSPRAGVARAPLFDSARPAPGPPLPKHRHGKGG